MIEKNITEEEVELAGYLCDPVVMAETLFTSKVNNLDSLKKCPNEEDSGFKVRLYQYPFLSYEYLLCEDSELSELENFNLKKGAGDIYMMSGRNLGKSVYLILDMCMDFMHHTIDWIAIFSSCTGKHVSHIMEPFINILEQHPFFKLFQKKAVRNPYKITTDSGYTMEGVNANITGKNKGANFESLRACKMTIDEIQYFDSVVDGKRSQAVSELGAILRFGGITSFSRTSPAGKIFDNLDKKSQIVNLPEYVSPYWTDEKYQEALNDYNGEDSYGYLVNIKAQVCESIKSLMDMERVSNCYVKNRMVKRYEIKKDDLAFLSDMLIIERLKNSNKLIIAADYGESASPTEIILVEKINNKYRYDTNISLHRLVPEEQIKVFNFLIELLEPNVVGVDATGIGGELFRRLVSKWGAQFRDNLVGVKFNEKMKIGFKKNNEGKIIIDIKTGEPEIEYAPVPEWSVRCLKKLVYYPEKIEISWDSKFHKQFQAMKAANIGNGRITYGSTEADHLWQAFQVFSICDFLTEPQELDKIKPQKACIGSFGSL